MFPFPSYGLMFAKEKNFELSFLFVSRISPQCYCEKYKA